MSQKRGWEEEYRFFESNYFLGSKFKKAKLKQTIERGWSNAERMNISRTSVSEVKVEDDWARW